MKRIDEEKDDVPLYIRQVQDVIKGANEQYSLAEMIGSFAGRLRLSKKVMVAFGIASIVMAGGAIADVSYFINRSAGDIRAASIAACQPPSEKTEEALGFLAAKQIKYYDPRKRDSDPNYNFTAAYARGLKAADPSLGPALDILDEARICNDLAELKADKLVGDRHLYDLLAIAGSIALGYATRRLYKARRSEQLDNY